MIDCRLSEYAENHTTPESSLLARLNRETHLTQVYPQMLAGHLQGTFLRMISQMIQPRRILEIGTFTGYSAINLAQGLTPSEKSLPIAVIRHPGSLPVQPAGSILHTIEVNPELEHTIRNFIHEAGLEEQIVLHIGDALEIIPKIEETWDLVFIDADKPNYLNYYKMVLPRLRTGGFIVADNVLWDGKVLDDKAKMDKDTRGIKQFNDFVQHDDLVENVILPFRDGIMMIRKKS